MARIKKVALNFDMENLVGVYGFRVYYWQGEFDWNRQEIPEAELPSHIDIPLVTGQIAYLIELPTMINLAEGTWSLGVCAIDASGNEGDIDIITGFFDFTPPGKPIWRR